MIIKSSKNWANKYAKHVVDSVPAYKKFLQDNKLSVKKLNINNLPLMDKENYLRKYPMKDILDSGSFSSGDLISMSSGTSGNPYYWLRGKDQHIEAADIYEKIYKSIFHVDKVETLLVVCFSMGTWIAGSYTTFGAMMVSQKGYPLNIITPGLETKDAIRAIQDLSDNYEQIIIAGYPPFVKDLLDYGYEAGINWKDINLGFTFAGEAISEPWRDFIKSLVSDSPESVKAINIYGTADAGIVGHETPISVYIRSKIEKLGLVKDYFGSEISPSFVQYDPAIRFVEEVDGRIVFTARSAIPLVRYDIKDAGGIKSMKDFRDIITRSELKNLNGYNEYKDFKFIYLHGRSDLTVTLYAVLIYPDNIKTVFLSKKLSKYFSSRFVMSTKYKDNHDQYLEIIVELSEDVTLDNVPKEEVMTDIIVSLEKTNSEYRKLKSVIGDKAMPVLIFKKNGDNKYFPKSINKQKWTEG